MSVSDKKWNNTQAKLNTIIGRYFRGSIPEGFELHASDLLSPEGEGFFSGHDREKRNRLTTDILRLISSLSHAIHLYAVDKAKLAAENCTASTSYDLRIPYLVAYDYLITCINQYVKDKLGQSARAMIIIDKKGQFEDDIENITRARRFGGLTAHRVKWIVEFSYPVDSHKNPMIQISDLIVFCSKKFLEIDEGYRNEYPPEAKRFYAEVYSMIHGRIVRHTLEERQGRGMRALNDYLKAIRSSPRVNWKREYGL